MNSLTKSLLEGLLEENNKIVALYGGGFKPPIGGHFKVVKEALKQYPEIDELIVLVGNKERNGISQSEAILIWEIYKNYLSPKINIQPSNSPIGDIYRFAKDNPQDTIYWVIGKREGADDDDKDIIDRAKELKNNPGKYNNLSLKIITTQDESMRGRNARIAAKKGKAYFIPFLPNILSKEDKNNIFDLVSPILNENATYSKDIDYKQMIVNLTNYMIKQGKNIEPLPKVKFINGDSKNAKNFLGKTAYYEPSTQTIVLYTEGRHPKDIVRSFSHEMVHHTQFLEDRLGDVSTTNTMEDDNINKLEQEANLKGTMTFRNWTDSLNENTTTNSYPFKVTDKTYDDEDNSLITVSYELTTPDNSYRVEFYSGEYRPEAKTFDLSFGVNTGDLNTIDTFQMTGEGNARKIFKTILNIVEDFINKEDVEKIVVDGTDEKRKRIYKAIFSSTPPNISDKIELKEAKNKDPFGLNQYARELAQGLEEAFLNEGKYTVYSDMDGVLVDFENRFKRFSKDIPPQKYEDKFGKEKFWDLIDNQIGVRFWAGMPWMSDGKQLWDYIKNYTPILLSSPSRSNSSRLGKRIWRKINLPSTKLILAQADKKQNYATPNSVLIDDRESNIDQWIKAGGIGILHTDTASTINKLKKLGL
jgi:hypothetical protein